MTKSITWIQRRGQIKHLLYELCLTGRIDRATLAEQFNDLNSVEPTKHGRWLKTGQSLVYRDKFRNYFCSICGFELDTHIRQEPNYCPNCGARMDAQIGEDKSHPFAESVMMGIDEVEE